MNKQTIIITGATSGIGLACAKLMSKNHTVIGIGRDNTRLNDLALFSNNIVTLNIDLTDFAQYYILKDVIESRNLNPLTFIHSAGVGLSQGFSSYDAEKVDRLFRTNVYSAFELIDIILPYMLTAGTGNICLVSSTAGIYGYKYNGAYCATKHALIGMVKSLAKEHGKRGIVATAICPGVVDTPMTEKTIAGIMKHKSVTKEEAVAILAATNPQHRIIPAEEVAEAIIFACSGKVPSLNGSSLVLGGGE